MKTEHNFHTRLCFFCLLLNIYLTFPPETPVDSVACLYRVYFSPHTLPSAPAPVSYTASTHKCTGVCEHTHTHTKSHVRPLSVQFVSGRKESLDFLQRNTALPPTDPAVPSSVHQNPDAP